MTINPIRFAHHVNQQFLRYQLTAFPLSDPDLAEQVRTMLGATGAGGSPLVKAPYVSIARAYKEGEKLIDLERSNRIHPAVAGIAEYPRMFAHQQESFEAVKDGNHCLVTTGTGSGKTEAFLYPILDHCFRLRDEGAPPGIAAILVYPMNALAADQLSRLRSLLAGTGITFGMYVGSTPQTRSDAAHIIQMKENEGREKIPEYEAEHAEHPGIVIAPFEESISEEDMEKVPPRILITNVYQLEFLMTRGKDIKMFRDAPLRFIVFDEAHTYTGARGAEVACLIRRLRAFCHKRHDEVICIGTSATIHDPAGGDNEALNFVQRFFGVDRGKIAIVKEQYRAADWAGELSAPPAHTSNRVDLLDETIAAVDAEDESRVSEVLGKLTGMPLPGGHPWRNALYDVLRSSLAAKTISDVLETPLPITKATENVMASLGRSGLATGEEEAELLTYLTLGAASERNGEPLLRPKLHYFVRGMEGAAVVLAEGEGEGEESKAELFFSREKAIKSHTEIIPQAVYPVLVCTNCGQHYLEARLSHIDGDKSGLNGGDVYENSVYWPRVEGEDEGVRIVFTNRFVSELEAVESPGATLDKKREDAYVCRFCGTFHRRGASSCSNPKCRRSGNLLKVHALKSLERVMQCPSCGQRGKKIGVRIIEPFRPLKASEVADIHILAQDMLNAQRSDEQRLIPFADNRQDAAFQAAWMANHARRYRLRHLVYNIIQESPGPISIGDIQDKLLALFKKDKKLARILAPEVFLEEVEEAFSSKLEKQLAKFLRINLLREVATGLKQRDSLETWGVVRVVYAGLDASLEEVGTWSEEYGIDREELASGIASLLDIFRRGRHLYDEKTRIFSRWWHYGSEEVQRGFLPYMDFPPNGLKRRRDETDHPGNVTGLTSGKGKTLAMDVVNKWGVPPEKVIPFINELWELLTRKLKILVPVELTDSKGRTLRGSTGVYQIDSAKLGLVAQHERYRCTVCRRLHTRIAPGNACTRYRCRGKTSWEEPPSDDYNVTLLGKEFTMLIAKEHTAQVPANVRQSIEDEFKRPDGTNCLVATPTLELGVDIGDLDVVLMRNVPPLPSNYWQRAGRAGRRHRMAVIYTYCRNILHDKYFFNNPDKIISGKINAPQFNLRNPVMIRKHLNATMLSGLISLDKLPPTSIASDPVRKDKIRESISISFPDFISDYLFEQEGGYRTEALGVSVLTDVLGENRGVIWSEVDRVFSSEWPAEMKAEVSKENLENMYDEIPGHLQEIIKLVHLRMLWTIRTRNKILEKEKTVPKLEEFEKRLLRRCRHYLERLSRKSLNTYTLNLLAREGFLPSYGSYEGSLVAFAENAYTSEWRNISFELSRPPTIAVREYVPGNLIYANAGRYRCSLLHLPLSKEQLNPDRYIIHPDTQYIAEIGSSKKGYDKSEEEMLLGIPICDVDLAFISHVSDEESNRFRLAVYLSGYLRKERDGGESFMVNGHSFDFLRGQCVRLVNAGPADRVREGEMGYPICAVCGATRSPYASDKEIEVFRKYHKKSCGMEPGRLALTADTKVDGIHFKDFPDVADAVNFAEALRVGANHVLEMDPDDLQILVLPKEDDSSDVFLYDPMSGGSGILNQLVESWRAILLVTIQSLKNCSCERSCYSCLRTYRNQMNHPYLDRKRAGELLADYISDPSSQHPLPPLGEEPEPEGTGTNIVEVRLRKMLLDEGFPPFDAQVEIPIPGPIKKSKPDLARVDEATGTKVVIYLDGLSKAIHGNEERQRIDNLIRAVVKSEGYEVIEIAASHLDDPEIMKYHYKSIASALNLN